MKIFFGAMGTNSDPLVIALIHAFDSVYCVRQWRSASYEKNFLN
ncbi:MAG: hypothetical protein OXO50_23420 [Caldilineaceae bacterium]|nr:hypothetical protein [Caldilineaceae bacterium]